MSPNFARACVVPLCLLLAASLSAAPKDTNFDEAKVPRYTLPDPLLAQDGTRIADAAAWRSKRRPEIVRLYEERVYGRSPQPPAKIAFEVTSTQPQSLHGKATRKEVTIYLLGKKHGPRLDLLLYLPNAVKKPAPAFIGLNFVGNHGVDPDPAIRLSKQWVRTKDKALVEQLPAESTRGIQASRWPAEMLVDRGYALATAFYGDIEPDFDGGWKHGLRAALGPQGADTVFAADAWGAIGAWSFGLSRALDYLEQDPAIDARHVALVGHSRLGKTALWAGAQDERFAIVISNDSGEGGAAISRRCFGEQPHNLVTAFPHWFCTNYRAYAHHEDQLPVDSHMLIALVAPRPVYVASASLDLWADPHGEFLGAKHAEPVYALFHRSGLGVDDMPPPDHPVGDTIAYHVRTGKHDIADFDWQQYLNFADRHFGKRK